MRPYVVGCVVGWSNPDCGPVSVRLYAVDDGPHPRWAEPHGRVAEVPLVEHGGAVEGDRAVVLLVGDRAMPADVLQRVALAAHRAVVAELEGSGLAGRIHVQRCRCGEVFESEAALFRHQLKCPAWP